MSRDGTYGHLGGIYAYTYIRRMPYIRHIRPQTKKLPYDTTREPGQQRPHLGPTRGRRPHGLGAPGPGVCENEITAVPTDRDRRPPGLDVPPGPAGTTTTRADPGHPPRSAPGARRTSAICAATRAYAAPTSAQIRQACCTFLWPSSLWIAATTAAQAGRGGGGACPGAWKRMRSFAAPAATPALKSEDGLHESAPGRSPPSIVQPGRRCVTCAAPTTEPAPVGPAARRHGSARFASVRRPVRVRRGARAHARRKETCRAPPAVPTRRSSLKAWSSCAVLGAAPAPAPGSGRGEARAAAAGDRA